LLIAASMIERGTLEKLRQARYAGWAASLGVSILGGGASLEDLERRVAGGEIDPKPVSGQQELLENLVNQEIWATDRTAPVGSGSDR
jgi:xylose isomerase